MAPEVEGWLFDCYPEEDGVRVWVIERDGRHRTFVDRWLAPFYVAGERDALKRGFAFLRRAGHPVHCRWTHRQELFSGESTRVLEVRVPPLQRDKTARGLRALGLTLYSADVHLIQHWHYDRGHFPLALCGFIAEGDELRSWTLRDDPWAVDYELPPLRMVHLALAGSDVAGALDPNHAARGALRLSYEGQTYELEGPFEEQLETLSRRMKEWDPDVLTTDWGDSFLLPTLDELAKKAGRALDLSRDASRPMGRRKDRSFMTYGRVIYQGGARYLSGRWHLDLKNSFIAGDAGLAGLFEIARIARIPVQRASRCTIGTSLSSMQMRWAWAQGVLIPMEKAQAEDFRPASDLLAADKGGLVYEPDVGWHEGVAEYDFTSMYPEMMVRHNISPETVNCACCPDELVPEIGHRLCAKRRGLVPEVLAPILTKRASYKKLAKTSHPDAALYKARAGAHKWTLVCCFGYLGFKNARFGKIEAHECVNAWGREVLLKAKESVENRGQSLLHAFVDALWFKVKPDADLEGLRKAVEEEAGCPLALEGVYKWLRFCPSKRDKLSGVPNRYFGAFQDGTLKIRGLACRRHDTPPLLKELQRELLERLARADGLAGCRAAVPELLDIVEGYRDRLKGGQVSAAELAITFTLSKTPDEYVHDTAQSIAAKQLAAAGVTLHAGETVRYVIANAKDKVKEWRAVPLALMENGLDYDAAKYLELLERAAKEILDGLIPEERKLTRREKAQALKGPELPLVWG
jgi:DNA polymerase II